MVRPWSDALGSNAGTGARCQYSNPTRLAASGAVADCPYLYDCQQPAVDYDLCKDCLNIMWAHQKKRRRTVRHSGGGGGGGD